jgi:hypothetical protein
MGFEERAQAGRHALQDRPRAGNSSARNDESRPRGGLFSLYRQVASRT